MGSKMANGNDPGVDRYSEEYFKSLLPPQQTDPTAPAATTPAPTEGTAPATPQWFTGGSDVDPYLRNIGIYANQLGVGLGQEAAVAGRVGMGVGRTMGIAGDTPAWMTPEEVESGLTIGGLTPQTPGERITAAAGRGGGPMIPFSIATRSPGPVIRGSMLGAGLQTGREAGLPAWATDIAGMAAGPLLFPGSGSGQAGLVAREPGAVSGIRAGDVLGTVGTAVGTGFGGPAWGMALGTVGKIVGSYGPSAMARLSNLGWTGLARVGGGLLFGRGIAGETTAPPGGTPTISVPNTLFPQP